MMSGGGATAAPTCTRTWDGDAGDGNWSTAANWNGDTLPTGADDVCLPTKATPYTVTRSQGIGIHSIQIAATATLRIDAIQFSLGADSTNAGTLLLDGTNGRPQLNIGDGNASTVEALTNTGTLRFANSTNAYYVYGDIQNAGTVKVEGNSAYFYGSADGGRKHTLTNTGTLQVDTGTSLTFDGQNLAQQGTITANGPIQVQSGGTLTVAGGTATGSGPIQADNSALTFTGSGSGSYRTRNNAALNGTIPANVTVSVFSGTTSIRANATNNGTLILDGTDGRPQLNIGDGNNQTLEALRNNGTLKFTGSTNQYYVVGDIDNAGTATVEQDGVYYYTSVDDGRRATWTNESGSTLTVKPGTSFTADQENVVQNGRMTNDGTLQVINGQSTLTVNGGSTDGANPVDVSNATVAFTDAGSGRYRTRNNSALKGTIPAGITLTITGTTTARADVTNKGTTLLDGTDGRPQLNVGDGNENTTETFHNAGTLRFVNSVNAYYVYGDVENSGRVEVPDTTSGGDDAYFFYSADNGRKHTFTNTGTLQVDSGASLRFDRTDVVQQGRITDNGFIQVQNNATITVKGGSTDGTQPIRVTSCTIGFTGTGSGSYRTDGNSALNGTIPKDVTLKVFAGNTVARADVTNNGTVIVDGSEGRPQLSVGDGNENTVETFHNAGTLKFTGSTNSYYVYGDLENTGKLDVADNETDFYYSADNGRKHTLTNQPTGTITVAANAALRVDRTDLVQRGTITDNGFIQAQNTAIVTVDGGSTGGTQPVRVSNCTINFSGTGSGAYRTDGNSALNGTIPKDVTLKVFTGNTVARADVTNNGTVIVDGSEGRPQLSVGDGNENTVETLHNAGTLKFTGSTNNYYVYGDVENTGKLDVADNEADFFWSADNGRKHTLTNQPAGTITVANNAALRIDRTDLIQRGTITNNGFLQLQNGAALTVNGGTEAGSQPVQAQSSSLTFDGASATGGYLVHDNNNLAGTIPAGVTLTLAPGSLNASKSVFNDGTIIFDGTTGRPTLSVADGDATTQEGFVNRATVRFVNGISQYYLSGDVTNAGTMTIAQDAVYLYNGNDNGRQTKFTNTGTLKVDGGFNLEGDAGAFNGGTITVADNAWMYPRRGFTQTAGSVALGKSAVLNGDGADVIDIGAGTSISGGSQVGPYIHNAGTLNVSGTLQVDGRYEQTATGTLVMHVTDTTTYDVLNINDLGTFAGKLDTRVTPGFTPTEGQVISPIRGRNNRVGKFAATVAEHQGQFAWVPVYTATGVNLRAHDDIPPQTTITAGPDGTTTDTKPTFTFTANEGATFECSLDAEDFRACSATNSDTVGPLELGEHTFAVWAIDQGGNVDRTFAFRDFTVTDGTTAPPAGTATPTPSAPPAATAAPIDTPAAPVATPTPVAVTDKTPPKITLTGGSQKLGPSLVVRLACDETCTATVGGTLKVTYKLGRKTIRKTVKLAAVKAKPGKVTLKLSAAARKLATKGTAVVTVSVKASDTAGNVSGKTLAVRLKQGRKT